MVMAVILYLATSGRVTVSQDEIHEVMHKARGVIENKQSTDVESPPPPRVWVSGGVLRTSTRSTLIRRSESVLRYEHTLSRYK